MRIGSKNPEPSKKSINLFTDITNHAYKNIHVAQNILTIMYTNNFLHATIIYFNINAMYIVFEWHNNDGINR